MRQVVRAVPTINANPPLPGDKSISHRALLLNSLASGVATVSNVCHGDDRDAILRCLRGLGVRIRRKAPPSRGSTGESFIVYGHGPYGFREPDSVLDAGNSGTTIRLVSGLLAALPFFSVISGDRSLRSRPMDRVVRPLVEMGAEIRGRGQDALAPLAIVGGKLHGMDYALPVASAQIKSCLLIAGLFARGRTTLHQPVASRDHTERLLEIMGADVTVDGLAVSVGRSDLYSVDVRVPGDISAAAFWLVLAACHPDARIRVDRVGINPLRTGVLDVLRDMGAKITLDNIREDGGEPSADLAVESSQLKAVEIGGDIIPRVIDELPVLALAACFAEGTTSIRDAHELRVKESDRIHATVEGLTNLGAMVEERADGMIVHGTGRLTGGETSSYGDHRLAMTMAIAGLLAGGETGVSDAEAAGVSYPDFWQALNDVQQVPDKPES
jgi:3-phosphoshikimate 1-carboxyvinyltransferase